MCFIYKPFLSFLVLTPEVLCVDPIQYLQHDMSSQRCTMVEEVTQLPCLSKSTYTQATIVLKLNYQFEILLKSNYRSVRVYSQKQKVFQTECKTIFWLNQTH